MKISIARQTSRYPRHIKVRFPLHEDWSRRMMLQRIVGPDVQLEREQETTFEAVQAGRDHPDVLYRFAFKYLDDILLSFPMADMSPALSKRIIQQAKDEIRKAPVPDLRVRGFQMYNRAGKAVDLFDYQKIVCQMGIDALLGKRGVPGQVSDTDSTKVLGFLNNLEMGLGKTAIAECTLVALHRNLIRQRKRKGHGGDLTKVSYLVIIPNNAKQAWKRALDANTRLDAVIVEGTFPQREKLIAERHDVTIINYETLRAQWDKSAGRFRKHWKVVPKHPSLFNHRYDAVVIDEYHRVKNPEAQQTIGFLHLDSRKFMPMSGTPILSKPEEAWPVLHRIWPHLFTDYETFCKALIQKEGGEILGYNPTVMVELKKFLHLNSVRVRKDQVLDQLPKELYVQKDIELTREQRKIYNRIRDEMLLELANGDEKKIHPFAMITRLKQASFSPELFDGSKHSAKIDELMADVEQLVASGEKAIIGSQWSKATRILEREFKKFNPAYVDGTVIDKPNNLARTAEVDRFNNDDDCRLYIGTIGANKEAITLHAATYVAMTDKDWTPSINRQFVMRSAAGGLRGLDSDVTSVTILEYIAEDTIESAIEEMLAKKQNLFNTLVEKDGGFKASRSTFKDIRDLLRKA